MIYLSVHDVIKMNQDVIEWYGANEQVGILSQSLLESAVFRPQQSAFGEDAYPTLSEKAGALFESLGQNHVFLDGNKRTCFLALTTFIFINGYTFEMDVKQAEDFVVDMVNHKYSFEDLWNIISRHCVKK